MPRKSLALSLSVLLALAWNGNAFAQQQKHKPSKRAAPETTTAAPAPRSPSNNPCAQYGAGFVRAPGSDTCIKIGGSVGVDVGGRF